MEKNAIVRLALDTYHGVAVAPAEFADKKPSEVLREALIAANGGSTKLDYKALRRNKVEIFEILEEVIPTLVQEGLKGDEFFMQLVDERTLSAGDMNEFWAEDNSTFIVSEMADGIATPRRQRIGEKAKVTINTTIHGVRIYEEMSRYLAGRIDWNDLVDKVAKAYTEQLRNDVYAVFSGISAATPGLSATYVKAGSYQEEDLLAIVDHVEAATGKKAVIVGTKPALRKCATAVQSEESKSDYYNAGFYGKLAGVPMVSIQNRHRVGTEEFIFPDNKLYVLASDDKPIKLVNEGEAYILDKDGTTNADMTMEYLYIEKYGVGLLVNGKLGVYTLS